MDGLRALAALYVVLHHIWLEIWPTDYHRLPGGVLLYSTAWMQFGHFAVSIFIVISGFCLALPVVRSGSSLERGVGRYLIKRARRILPPYYCALLLTLLLTWLFIGRPTGTNWDGFLPVTLVDVVYHLLLLQDVYGGGKINGAFWSIAVEWRIYFWFPLLVALHRLAGPLISTILVVAVPYAFFLTVWLSAPGQTWFANQPHMRIGYVGLAPTYLALFGLGMFAASVVYARQNVATVVRDRFPWIGTALLAALLAFGLCWYWGAYPAGIERLTGLQYGVLDLLVGIIALCVLARGSQPGRNLLRDGLAWKPLVLVGTFSYSLYHI